MGFIDKAGTDIYAFVILLLVLGLSFSRIEWSFFSYRVFFYLVVLTMVQLIIEAFVWFISSSTPGNYLLIHILNSLFLFLNPFPPLLWNVYAHYQLHDDELRSKRFFYKMLIPLIINTVIIIATPVNTLLFNTVVEKSIQSSAAIFTTAMLCFSYMVFTIFMTISMTGKIDKRRFSSIIFFSVPPIIGGALDMSIPGLSTLWPAVVISILFIYINIQNQRINTDPLTGLYNRRQLEARLEKFIGLKRVGVKFAMFLIDINDFKKVNDNFGHVQGDKVLEDTAKILKSCFRASDFVARYAGDEFIAITKVHSENDMEEICKRITKALELYNHTALVKVFISIGYSIYEENMEFSSKEFIDYVDDLMYLEKSSKF